MAATVSEDIVQLFDEVQQSKRTHKANNKKLHAVFSKLSDGDRDQVQTLLLRGILDQSLLYPKSSPFVDRVVDFIAVFFAQSSEIMHSALIDHAKVRVFSSHKHVRARVCELLARFLSYCSEQEIGLGVEVLQGMSHLMIIRLKDKIAAVRLSAIQALRYLQDPEQENDPVITALLVAMARDPQSSIRKAVVESITLSETTKASLVRRILDVKAEVRAAVLHRLIEETDIRQFPKEQRLLLAQHGLQDRDAHVQFLTERLLLRWLSLLGNDIVKLLAYFASNSQEDVLLLVGTALAEKAFAQTNGGLTDQEASTVSALRATLFKWDALANGRTALNEMLYCDLAWQFIRLRYAQKFLNTFSFMNACEESFPDVEVFVQAVKRVHERVKQSDAAVSAFKYLLLLCQLFVASCDITAAKSIEEMVIDLLKAGDHAQTDLLMLVLQQIHLPPSAPASAVGGFASKIFALVETVSALGQEDCAQQLIQWALANPLLGRVILQSHAPTIRERVLAGLQSTYVESRELAMQILGATSVLSLRGVEIDAETSQLFLGLAKHVATSNIEETAVRSQALHVLADLALLSQDAVEGKDMASLLHGLLSNEQSSPELFPVALESAVKLVFNGFLDAPEVVHQLLTHFFLPNPSSSTGSAHQQLLSLFLSSCLTTPVPMSVADPNSSADTVKTCVDVLCESLSLFISDFATRVRDQIVEPSKLQHVVQSLLGLVSSAHRSGHEAYNRSLQATAHSIQVAFLGNICRELLKTNLADKGDRIIFRDFSRIVCSLETFHESPLEENRVALRVMAALHEQLLNSSSTAKPTAAHTAQLRAYQQWMTGCHRRIQEQQRQLQASGQEEAGAQEALPLLLRWACGLSDLLQLTQTHWDEPSVLLGDDEESVAPRTRRAKGKNVVAAADRIAEESGEEEEESDESEDSDDEELSDDDHVVQVPIQRR